MTLTRRRFLAATTAAVAGAVFDPERALWIPGQRSYFDIVRPQHAEWPRLRRLRQGDVITLSGYEGTFVVTSVVTSDGRR